MAFYNEVKNTRANLGKTQEEFAKKLGLARGFLAQIESGWKPLPSKYLPKLKRLKEQVNV